MVSTPPVATWPQAELVPRHAAVTILIEPGESPCAKPLKLGALNPTIAVRVHPGKSFGKSALDAP